MITLRNQDEFNALVKNEVFEVQEDVTLKFDLNSPSVTLKVGGDLTALDIKAGDITAAHINVCDMSAWCVKASSVEAQDLLTGNIKVFGDLEARDIDSGDITARDVKAISVKAGHVLVAGGVESDDVDLLSLNLCEAL